MKSKKIKLFFFFSLMAWAIGAKGLITFPTIFECKIKTPLPVPDGAQTPDHFIIVHGLNLRPSKMRELGAFLKSLHFKVTYITLKGHGEGEAEKKLLESVSAQTWLTQINHSYCQAKTPSNKVYFLGYSLGATYGLIFQHFYPMLRPFHKMILFAPAIKIRSYTKILKLLSWWPTFPIPSKSLREYRVHSFLPINAYNNTFQGVDIIERAHPLSSQVQTLIFLAPQDELIHYKKTVAWIEKRKLTLWRIIDIKRDKLPLKNQTHHLIIGHDSLGPIYGPMVFEKMRPFLQRE